MQRGRFPIERNGASEKTKTPAPNYALDNAVVVIDVMTTQIGVMANQINRMTKLHAWVKETVPRLASQVGVNLGHAASGEPLSTPEG